MNDKKSARFSSVPCPPRDVLILAAWFVLLTCLGDIGMQAIRKLVLHSNFYWRAHIVWMILLANLLVFAIPTAVLLILAWSRRLSLLTATASFSIVSFVCLLFYAHYRLHPLALTALAIGFAVQAARFLASRPTAYRGLVTRTLPGLAVMVALLGTAIGVWRIVTERRAMVGIPSAPEGSPNVLLIVWDTARSLTLSLYGDKRPTTPNLERLALQGVRFDHAIATSSWTLPSHASMFTARYPHEVASTLFRKPMGTQYPTLAEVLRARGYATGAFVANYFYASREYGLNRGFTHYEDYTLMHEVFRTSPLLEALSVNGTGFPALKYREIIGRKRADDVDAEFLDWLPERPDRPFFAFLNYFDAHIPYKPPPPFDRKFSAAGDAILDVEWDGAMPKGVQGPEKRKALESAYAGSIAYLDDRLGKLVAELERRGLLENTLLIITSDHGESLGEHSHTALGHSTSLYLTELQVPLVMKFARRLPQGQVVRAPVTLRDIPATVMDLAGFAKSSESSFPGFSLARQVAEGKNEFAPAGGSTVLSSLFPMPGWTRKDFPVFKGKMASIVRGTLHYIRNGDGREELYDFTSDPLEQRDLVPGRQQQDALAALRFSLDSVLAKPNPADPSAKAR
ncbi:MAG: sulfatase [Gemmatimonadaceae bacterium]|nr:sulfatase [Gemmatimonadaceae bacterium]MDQ3519228.1 sulfatase [Gemmatimonadota bacterium]